MQVFQMFLQVLAFLITNRAQIIEIITGIEALIPDAPGSEKAAAAKAAIAKGLNVESAVETAWPMIQPIFDLLVASAKGKK